MIMVILSDVASMDWITRKPNWRMTNSKTKSTSKSCSRWKSIWNFFAANQLGIFLRSGVLEKRKVVVIFSFSLVLFFYSEIYTQFCFSAFIWGNTSTLCLFFSFFFFFFNLLKPNENPYTHIPTYPYRRNCRSRLQFFFTVPMYVCAYLEFICNKGKANQETPLKLWQNLPSAMTVLASSISRAYRLEEI